MERAQRVPLAGMAGEIALGRGRAIGANSGEPGGVGRPLTVLAVELGPALEQLEQGLQPRPLAEADEYPAAFLVALGEAGIDEDLDVA